MKNKGFTLIELLAVIVILAIIALIATPIILNIIGDSKKESDKRNIELYGKAIELAIARKNLTEEVPKGNYVANGKTLTLEDSEFTLTIDYENSQIECATTVINEDGTVYLDECMVNGTEVNYSYGKEQKHLYYSETTSVSKIGDPLPDDKSTTPPGGNFYLGLYTKDEKTVSEAYVCFKKNEKEYCLKGFDKDAHNLNQETMRTAFGDNVCAFEAYPNDLDYNCDDGSLYVQDNSSIDYVRASHYPSYCIVDSNGTFYCGEWDS